MSDNAASSGPTRMAKSPGSAIADWRELKFEVHLLTPFSLLRI